MENKNINTEKSEKGSTFSSDAFFDFIRSTNLQLQNDRYIGGVCSAFANRFGWSTGVVRLVAFISIFLGFGIPAYAILWALLPDAITGVSAVEKLIWKGSLSVGIVVPAILLLVFLAGSSALGTIVLIGLIIAAIVIFVSFNRSRVLESGERNNTHASFIGDSQNSKESAKFNATQSHIDEKMRRLEEREFLRAARLEEFHQGRGLRRTLALTFFGFGLILAAVGTYISGTDFSANSIVTAGFAAAVIIYLAALGGTLIALGATGKRAGAGLVTVVIFAFIGCGVTAQIIDRTDHLSGNKIRSDIELKLYEKVGDSEACITHYKADGTKITISGRDGDCKQKEESETDSKESGDLIGEGDMSARELPGSTFSPHPDDSDEWRRYDDSYDPDDYDDSYDPDEYDDSHNPDDYDDSSVAYSEKTKTHVSTSASKSGHLANHK